MKRRLTFASLVLGAIASVLLTAPLAHADSLTLTLLDPNQGGLPGQTLSFFATVSTPSTNTGLEYLNGDTFSISSPITLNDSSYINTFPLDLGPGVMLDPGLLFTVFIPAAARPGPYPGSFSITGGPTDTSAAILSTTSFVVYVTAEPSPLLMVGTGIGILAAALRLRRRPRLG